MSEITPRDGDLSLVKIRGAAQITLPGAIRKALQVREGDYLEAELVEGGVFFKPVAIVDRAAARTRLLKTLRKNRYIGRKPEPSEDELNRMIMRQIRAVRRSRRK